MLDQNAVLVAVIAVFIFLLFARKHKSSNAGKPYPPSIPSLPLLGSIPFFTGGLETMHIFLMQKAERLGPVIRLYAGPRYSAIVIQTLLSFEKYKRISM